jgi:hypothetical protein
MSVSKPVPVFTGHFIRKRVFKHWSNATTKGTDSGQSDMAGQGQAE